MDNTKKFILINLGLLVLELIWGTWQYNQETQYSNSLAGLVWFFVPVIHAAFSILLALVFLIVGDKKMAKNFGLLFLTILLIGFSFCGLLMI